MIHTYSISTDRHDIQYMSVGSMNNRVTSYSRTRTQNSQPVGWQNNESSCAKEKGRFSWAKQRVVEAHFTSIKLTVLCCSLHARKMRRFLYSRRERENQLIYVKDYTDYTLQIICLTEFCFDDEEQNLKPILAVKLTFYSRKTEIFWNDFSDFYHFLVKLWYTT